MAVFTERKKTEEMVEEKETIPSFWRRLYWWADPLWTWGPAVSQDCWPGSCSAIGPKKGKKSETASHSTWIHICACPVFCICGHDPAWSIFTGSKPCSDCVGVHGFPNVSVHVSDELSIWLTHLPPQIASDKERRARTQRIISYKPEEII